jgi:hypothetical protein
MSAIDILILFLGHFTNGRGCEGAMTLPFLISMFAEIHLAAWNTPYEK